MILGIKKIYFNKGIFLTLFLFNFQNRFLIPNQLHLLIIIRKMLFLSIFEKILSEIAEGLKYFFFCIHNKGSISYHGFINWSASQNQ